MKKGFTLIEVVIALALLLVSVTSVNLVFSNSDAIWKLSGYKQEDGAFNQAISQRLRAEGKRNIVIIVKNIDTSVTPADAYFYIYFDTAEEISTCVDKAIDNTEDGYFKKIGYTVLASTTGNFTNCNLVSNNTGTKKYGALVKIEDNPYGELRYDGENIPSIKSLDTEKRVVYLGTFSKTFSPGLRIGWVCAEDEILNKYIMIKLIY